MRLTLNGRPIELATSATVVEAVQAAGVEPQARGVAVAVDGQVVPRAEWPGRALREDESVEVVHAVQGG